jgi:hypothetical protein
MDSERLKGLTDSAARSAMDIVTRLKVARDIGWSGS